MRDETQDRCYYVNKYTRETTWDKPTEAAKDPAADTPLPPGWKAVADESSGRTYYYNKETKATVWEKPTA